MTNKMTTTLTDEWILIPTGEFPEHLEMFGLKLLFLC